MNEMTNDAAVAWVGDRALEGLQKCRDEQINGYIAVYAMPEGEANTPLYSATTVAELRAEIAAYRAADESMQEELGRQVSLRMAAERRGAELEAFLPVLWGEYESAAEYMGEGCLGVDPHRRSQFAALTKETP